MPSFPTQCEIRVGIDLFKKHSHASSSSFPVVFLIEPTDVFAVSSRGPITKDLHASSLVSFLPSLYFNQINVLHVDKQI